MALEDAGFEVRDVVTHLFGTGFPKSLDVSKAIDKAAGAERPVIGQRKADDIRGGNLNTAPATDAARQWQGFGTSLKPACEFWWLVRKPLGEKTVAANVLKHGTGALNIDGCRIGTTEFIGRNSTVGGDQAEGWGTKNRNTDGSPLGRFPANLVLDEEAAALLDKQSGITQSGGTGGGGKTFHGVVYDQPKEKRVPPNAGGASRFFYVAKASRADRNSGLEGLPQSERHTTTGATRPNRPARLGADPQATPRPEANTHPTVKSTKLMSYLCRLVTPPGGVVLDPFMGSGSTGVAALAEGFRFVGIEAEAAYFAIAKERLGA